MSHLQEPGHLSPFEKVGLFPSLGLALSLPLNDMVIILVT